MNNTVNLKKITFTLRQVRTIEVEVSAEQGHSMPTNIPALIDMVDSIKLCPTALAADFDWQIESNEAVDIEYTGGRYVSYNRVQRR